MKSLDLPKILSNTLLFVAAVMLAACSTKAPAPAGPSGKLQAHVWQCSDGSTINTRNLSSPAGIALRTGAETRTLPQVRAASGVRYQDAAMQFLTKGDSATLERQAGATVDCREVRSLSLLEDARVRGITFRGVGNEPGWRLEIGPAHRVMFEDGYGSMRIVFQSLPPLPETTSGVTIHENTSGSHRLKVTLRREICADSMSDETFPYSVDVEIDGARRRGCGTSLR
jgi:putative lipoprotein